ncbi:MAG: hypothetical protein GY757_25705 [bacterium]|nr:hypothetical protein [bacterium]
MKYLVILLLMFSLMGVPGEGEKSKVVVKKLVPDYQQKKTSPYLASPDIKKNGKNDPFWDLLKKETNPIVSLESLKIEEIRLEGIVKMKSGAFHALFISPKNKPFIAAAGQKLFNGWIEKITFNEVIFKKK